MGAGTFNNQSLMQKISRIFNRIEEAHDNCSILITEKPTALLDRRFLRHERFCRG